MLTQLKREIDCQLLYRINHSKNTFLSSKSDPPMAEADFSKIQIADLCWLNVGLKN